MRHHAGLVAICVTSALLIAGGLTAALGVPRALASTIISGTVNSPVGKCSYSVTTDSTDYSSTVNYTAQLTCGPITATATGSASPDADGTDEDLSMDEIKVSAYGQDLDITTGFSATIPVNAQTVADIHTFWDQAVGVMASTSAEQVVSGAVGAVTASDSLQEAASAFGFGNIVSDLNNQVCDTLDLSAADKVCSKREGTAAHDALLRGVGGTDSLDEAAACPPLAADPPSDYFVVCMPTFIAGSTTTSKNIIVTPGGALMSLPLTGSLSAPLGSPTVKTSGSFIAIGAGIAGAGINLVAGKDIDIAGSMIGTLGPVTFQASSGTVNIGSFSLSSALSFIASLAGANGEHPNNGALGDEEGNANAGPDPSLLDKALGQAKTLVASKSATIPAFVDAPSVKISAKNANVSAGSEVSVSGWGLPGGQAVVNSGVTTGGARLNFGGSHAGLGGFSTESTFAQQYLGMGGRGHSTDNPVNPTLAGGGGAGDVDSNGKNGGGVLTAAVPGTFTLNGTVSADGDDPGWIGSGDHGGGGAGGSVNLTVGTIAGSGTVHANGGSLCSFCVNGNGGGLGGGGMVAVSYTATAFKGSLHALPGYNPAIKYGTDFSYPYDAPGGAGTVFTIQRTVKGKPAPKWPAGVLTLDGRPLTYPADDGTPLPIAWNNPKRALIVANGAVGYGTSLAYGSITLKNRSRLTTLFGSHNLSLTAPAITVDKTSRIDVSDRGYLGGNPNDSAHDFAGKTAPGKTAPTGGFGGSHGGAGGANSQPGPGDHRGATYDSVTKPVLPGGGGAGIYPYSGIPGGGVLLLHATTLNLAGVIAANGGSTEGPTAADPIRWSLGDGGSGAGGAIQVIVTTLTGAGTIQANGGNNCLGVRQLLPDSNICGGSSSGAGGGGRVAVTAPHRKAWTGHVTAFGGVNFDFPGRADIKGKSGTVWLSVPAKS